jgi:hypothetical protein
MIGIFINAHAVEFRGPVRFAQAARFSRVRSEDSSTTFPPTTRGFSDSRLGPRPAPPEPRPGPGKRHATNQTDKLAFAGSFGIDLNLLG